MFERQPQEKENFTHEIVDYLQKPVKPSLLIEAVAKVISEPHPQHG